MASSSIKVTLLPPSGEKLERIFDSHSITIGRSSKSDLILDTESLSRKHCRIDYEDGIFYITDLSSTNGVFIQGERIPALVKKPFNNFLPLQISVYECIIHEVDITAIRSPAILNGDTLTLMTMPTKKLNFNALNRPLKTQPPKKKSVLQDNYKFFLSALIFMGVILYALVPKEEMSYNDVVIEERDIVNAILLPKTEDKILVKSSDEFLSPNIYLQLYGRKDCQESLYCENLLLSMEDGEGLVKEGNDFIVYIKNISPPDNEKYSQVSGEEQDLIALDQFLTSRLLDDYLTHKIDQIHLVIVNPDNSLKNVYRFHPNKFSLQLIDRQVINTLLTDAIYHGKTKEFWLQIDPSVQKLDLPQ